MEQYDPISFASVISSLLLCKRVLSANEIINFTSALSCEGMDIDDEWNIDVLQPIVFMDERCSFGLGKQFNYNTLLPSGVTVDEFLRKYADSYNKKGLEKQIQEKIINAVMENIQLLDRMIVEDITNQLNGLVQTANGTFTIGKNSGVGKSTTNMFINAMAKGLVKGVGSIIEDIVNPKDDR